ncbi:MAG TPA: hypothetical protein PL059_03875 [Spirochaetota bacterium]|nr:hypothetical protein [Spirochaetota bacterium]HOM09844.1 hypothetical protein [Spirochaetota bacterium]HPP49688.1 hypothetical protein [Spirochaetota bacterium]
MDATIISYPDTAVINLLSLTANRSKYMIPFAGKFRVVDFVIGNARELDAQTIIYSNVNDDLTHYVALHGIDESKLKVVVNEFNSIDFCYSLIRDSDSAYFIMYNGDNPGIIDFAHLIERFAKMKKPAALFKMHFEGKARMAHRILVSTKKALLATIRQALKHEHTSPNIFEMIINMMVNEGLPKLEFSCMYWPLGTIVDYYNYNYEVINNPEFSKHVFNGHIHSRIQLYRYSMLGPHAKVVQTFLSDSSYINGEVVNSIIFPGVEIAEGAVIRDSIILPYNKIGAKARIMRSIIDERTVQPFDQTPLTIGNGCKIGTTEEGMKNSDYPKVLYNSITLIGKNCIIPDAITIGGCCYVSPGKTQADFEKRKYIYNGTSV